MKKKTKIILLAVMVVLLGVTGYLNVVLNSSVKEPVPVQTTTASYFASYRQDREDRREQAILYYKAIADSPTSTPDAVESANNARLALIERMDTELMVEGLIKGIGFNDCVITMSTKNINVLVDSKVLTEDEVTKIVDVVQEYLGTELKYIKVIPVD